MICLNILFSLENRNCANCKWFIEYDKDKKSGHCSNERSIAYNSESAIYGEDGCISDWESKDD